MPRHICLIKKIATLSTLFQRHKYKVIDFRVIKTSFQAQYFICINSESLQSPKLRPNLTCLGISVRSKNLLLSQLSLCQRSNYFSGNAATRQQQQLYQQPNPLSFMKSNVQIGSAAGGHAGQARSAFVTCSSRSDLGAVPLK